VINEGKSFAKKGFTHIITSKAGGSKMNEKRFEIICGMTIAFLAAILAVTDIGAGKYGDDELISHNEKTTAFAWYDAKGIKQNLAEGQRDMLISLIKAGGIQKDQVAGVESLIVELNADIARYKKEKNEILLGSAKVGSENWVQDVNGEMGKVIGAKEYEDIGNKLGAAGDKFDYASLFLQLCLVMGAISLVLQIEKVKWVFFGVMVALGTVGTVFSVIAYVAAAAI
jgi:hypothetical protein